MQFHQINNKEQLVRLWRSAVAEVSGEIYSFCSGTLKIIIIIIIIIPIQRAWCPPTNFYYNLKLLMTHY